MTDGKHKNSIYDISFFKINTKESTITFENDSNIEFKVIQSNNKQHQRGYEKTLFVDDGGLLEYFQVQVLDPKKISMFFNIIQEEVLLRKMSHIKRVKKDAQNNIFVLLCIKHLFADLSEITKRLAAIGLFEEQDYKFSQSFAHLPASCPANKAICDEWSSKYWPLNWKGNTKENQLKQIYLNEFQMPTLEKFIELFTLVNSYKLNAKELPMVTLFYNFKNGKTFIFQDKTASTRFPLAHSVITGIDEICNSKTDGNNEYLLQDFYVITTHEPCQMCSMALIHSRIKLLLFAKTTTNGALSKNDFCLGDFDKLNWKYQVLHYNFMK